MSKFRADLHCHTTCSDGTLTVPQIINLALKMNLQGLSITDHDTIAAYDQLLDNEKSRLAPISLTISNEYGQDGKSGSFPIARENCPTDKARAIGSESGLSDRSASPREYEKSELQLIPGVEFSTVHRDTSIHLLAYAFPISSEIIRGFSKQHFLRRQERNQEILSLLRRHKMPIEETDFNKICQGMPGRVHIAQVMLEKKYVGSIAEAFKKYLGEGKCCYYPGKHFTVEETLDVIRSAGALAIIAHPHLIKQRRIINDLLEMDFDGIEAYYARFSGYDEQKWVNIAREKEWIVTGGSDFHGEIRPQNPLGCSWVCEETFRILKDHYLSHENLP